MAADVMAASHPLQVGPWRLEARLGAGGFGTVWRARDAEGRAAVVKLLEEPPGEELRALDRVRHPAVAVAISGGSFPVPHLVMSLAPGSSLSTWRDQSERSVPEVLSALAVLADALAACHEGGVVHGDIKPDNAVIDPETGSVVLVDFGLSGKRGGTPEYAAPEVLDGEVACPASDVYSLGLLAIFLLSGERMLPETLHARLEQRARQAPAVPARAGEALGALITSMLSPNKLARPSARVVSDTLESLGARLPERGGRQIRERARAVSIPRPDVDRALSRFLSAVESGASARLTVTGPSGSGKSHLVRAALRELQAKGIPAVTLASGGPPWSAIDAALSDPSLPGATCALPVASDDLTRAELCAEALLGRSDSKAVFIVDDADDLDEGSQIGLEALGRSGASILSTAARPRGDRQHVPLDPLDPPRVAMLVEGLLGPVDGSVALLAGRVAGRWPEGVVLFCADAADQGAIVWRRGAWVVDPIRLEALASGYSPGASARDTAAEVARLSPATVALGATVALAQPLPSGEALVLSGGCASDIAALVEASLVRGSALLTCASDAAAQALIAAAPDLRALCRKIASRLLSQTPTPWSKLARLLADCEDRDLIDKHGARAVQALLEVDVAGALTESSRMLALAEPSPLVSVHVAALVRAHERDRAVSFASRWIEAHPDDPDRVALLVQLANLEDSSEDPARMQAWLDKALAAAGPSPPATLKLALARASFRAKDFALAESRCQELCAGSPGAGEGLARWLSAKALLAQSAAASRGASAGLLALADVPEELGRGSSERALLDGVKGRLLWHAGRQREAAAAMESAAAMRRALSTIDRSRLENNAGLCWYSAGDTERAVSGWERALLGFERVGAEIEVARVLVNLCQGYRDLGRWSRAEESGQRAVDLAHAHREEIIEAVALGNLGDCALWQRKFSRARQLWDAARVLAQRREMQEELVEIARRRLELAVAQRDPDAPERAEESARLARAAGAEIELARTQALSALLFAREGDRQRFAALQESAIEALRRCGAGGELAAARLAVAEGWAALGDARAAVGEAEQVLQYATEFVRPPLRARAEQIIAQNRRAAPGESRLERLTELAVRLALQVDLGELLTELAAAAVELVDADRAIVLRVSGGQTEIVARAGEQGELPSMSIVHRVLALGREVVVADLAERGDLRQANSVVAMHISAVFAVPLVVDDSVEGVLYLDRRAHPASSLESSTRLLRALGAHASVALRNAELARQIQARADDARELAHDLRNPLSGIALLAADAVESGDSIDPEDARLMLDGVNHALALVEQLLQTESASRAPLALSRWLQRRARELQIHARRQEVKLLVEADAPGLVRAEEPAIWRVVTNLITNALKYTSPGGTIELRTLLEGDKLGIEVLDTGTGIPPGDLTRIFDRGYRPKGSRAGHGLGLAIVRRIVDAHGGSVKASNRSEGGARFVVWLPRMSADTEA